VINVGSLNVAAGQTAGAGIAALPSADRPTAVFCSNDLIALGFLQEMTRNRIRVPELGRTAARMLVEEAAADETHQHQQVIFEPQLVVRQSTTPA
jgi:LacI family transcriptional regulator